LAQKRIDHKEKKDSTLLYFIIGIIPFVNLYLLWKGSEVVSGHEKILKNKYEVLTHKEKKDSTLLWFIIGIIPIVDLYFLWKGAEAVSGHEKIYK
jgi:hypothetical protein